jgi:hypothetical protein
MSGKRLACNCGLIDRSTLDSFLEQRTQLLMCTLQFAEKEIIIRRTAYSVLCFQILPINQSTNQPTSQPASQPANRAKEMIRCPARSVFPTIANESINQSTKQPANQPANQPTNRQASITY